MASTRNYYRSFAGGQISAQMFGRIDDAKFQTGAGILRNFVSTPTGAAENRAGFAYVCATKNNGVARLIPFTYDVNQTMAIELGAGYARFHTLGETLQYDPSSIVPWIPPSGALTFAYASPSIVTWAAHGLANGDPIRFYAYDSTAPVIPGGLLLGYSYTVQVLDANTFYLIDNDALVTLTDPAGSSTSTTTFTGSGTAEFSLNLIPNQTAELTGGSSISGLESVTVPGGVATLNCTLQTKEYKYNGTGSVLYQYSTDGVTWNTFNTASFSSDFELLVSVAVSISVTDLSTLSLRVAVQGTTQAGGSVQLAGEITAWSVSVPSSAASGAADVRAYYYYAASDMVSYDGAYYVAVVNDSGGLSAPGSYSALVISGASASIATVSGNPVKPRPNSSIWYELPTDLTYEIPTPYVVDDLFAIHYTQSADVMTLVHQNYAPAELSRLGATAWSLINIAFGPPLASPLGVTVVASPGYLAQISSISTVDPSLITTKSNHTLALGDGIYIANLTGVNNGAASAVLDGFYMVQNVPADSSGDLIENELTVSDYSGNSLSLSSWSATDSSLPVTIQYGTQTFNITSYYVVQAIESDGVSTSAISTAVSVLNNLDVPGSYNTVSWDAVTNAQSYNVYKQLNGLYGYIGNTESLTFVDNNIAPDMSITPGYAETVFSDEDNYPGAVCYFQQRRCFGGTINAPQNVWMTNSGTESMLSYSLPSESTDRISFRVVALQSDVIQHLVPMLQLMMLTSEAEFALNPGSSDAVTPSNISVQTQSYIGASSVQPTIINTTMVYAAARGGHVREMGYAWTVNGYMTGDLSLRAADLFDNLTIVDQSYSKAPKPIVWFVSSNGNLLGLTYIPEEQIGAWHWHDTEGSFESVCCVAEGSEDVLYAVINRTIDGQTVRYIERLQSRVIDPDDSSTWFFVDAGITQTFTTPVTEISGLTWLEGCTVAVLGDGGVQAQKVVKDGAITLDHAVSTVTVGLPYLSQLQTLPPVLQMDGYGQGRMKNLNKAWLKLYQSSSIFVGPDVDHLTEIKQRTTEPWGSPPSLQSAELELVLSQSWQASGQIFVQQSNPLPLTLVGMTQEVSIGG